MLFPKPQIKNWIIIILLILLSGCSLLKTPISKAKALSMCTFELIDVNKKISFTERTSNIWNYVIEVTIHAANNSSENISLGRYQFDLYANEKLLSKIETNVPISLKASSTTSIIAKTVVSPSGTLGVFLKKLFDLPIEYKINGTFFLTIGNFTIPLERQLIKFVDKPK